MSPRITALAATLLAAGPAGAADSLQDPARPVPLPIVEEPEDDGRLDLGAYVAPQLKLTSLTSRAALLAGGEAGVVLDHVLVLGAAGYGTLTEVVSPAALQPPAGGAADLSLGYGGLHVGGVLWSRRPVHVTFGVLAGGGSVRSETDAGAGRRTAGVLVVEPDVEIEVPLGRWVRVSAGVSFRLVEGTDLPSLTSRALSGPAAGVALKVGSF